MNSITKVKILCKEHNIFNLIPYTHLNGTGCPECGEGRIRYNNKKIITAFRKVHGDKYDYTLVDYKSSHVKVKILCKQHGAFEQQPANHLSGNGCPNCGGRTRYNNEKIINEFRKVHGDKYDYSLVDYKKTNEKVKIICKEHGVFEQQPSYHLVGQGCRDCSSKVSYNNEKIIAAFHKIHRDKYDYTLVDYKSIQKKVKIICKEHGVFEQRPSKHLKGQGCQECGGRTIYNNEKIIVAFRKVHGNKYDYSLVDYKKTNENVKIICSEHGEFKQRAANHLRGKDVKNVVVEIDMIMKR